MAEDTEYSQTHFREMEALVRSLASRNIAVFEHQYHYLAFGGWVVVAGHRKHRVRIAWDGREFAISCDQAQFADSELTPSWSEISYQRLGPDYGSPYAKAIELIGSVFDR